MTAAAWALFAAATPSPTPSEGVLRPGVEETDVSPGLVGFLVTFALVLACVVLFVSMSRHLRKTRQNAEVQGLEVQQRKGIGIRTQVPPAVPVEEGTWDDESESGSSEPGSDSSSGGSSGRDSSGGSSSDSSGGGGGD